MISEMTRDNEWDKEERGQKGERHIIKKKIGEKEGREIGRKKKKGRKSGGKEEVRRKEKKKDICLALIKRKNKINKKRIN